MLVLSRFPEQIIRIGENIEIHIMKVQGNRVSVGIDAPKDVKIIRKEIIDRDRDKDD